MLLMEEWPMPTKRLLISVPAALKAKLEAARAQGLTTSGLIRHLLNQYFTKPEQGGKARKP